METIKVPYPVLGHVLGEMVVNCVIVLLVLLTVSLRVIGRLRVAGLGWDDGMVIFATPLGVAMLVCQGLFIHSGNGWILPQHPELAANIPYILQLTLCMEIIYVVLLAAVKSSMLFFYLRVFVTPWMQRASKALLVFVAVWMISYLAACIFVCNPVSAQWTGLGTCGQYIHMIQSLIATNAIGDLVIMALPMHSIWSLQMRKTDKLGVTSCFALGFACVVCAVFRLIYISTVDLNGDITGTMSPTVLLFVLEPNLAILCVSIPMLRPFYHMYKKRTGGSRLHEYSDEQSGYMANSKSGGQKRTGQNHTGNENMSTWEMDKYYKSGGVHNDAVVSAASGDELGPESSETSLVTTPRVPRPPPKDMIGVETKWTVSRS